MEIVMQKQIDELVPQQIDFNYEDIKKELSEKLTYYKNLKVTEDSIKLAKEDKAKLNALSKALNAKRIADQKQYMKPFDDYKLKIDGLIAMINEPTRIIDSQLQVFEDNRKAERLADLTRFYTTNISSLCDLVPFKKLFKEQYLNKTVSLISAEQEIAENIQKIRNDLDVITNLKSEFDLQIKDTYLRNFDLSEALAEKTRLEEQAKKIAEIVPAKEVEKVEEKIAEQEETEEIEVIKEENSEVLRTITVTFVDTSKAFRAEMQSLVEKYNIELR